LVTTKIDVPSGFPCCWWCHWIHITQDNQLPDLGALVACSCIASVSAGARCILVGFVEVLLLPNDPGSGSVSDYLNFGQKLKKFGCVALSFQE
jgi:hypothetical protein